MFSFGELKFQPVLHDVWLTVLKNRYSVVRYTSNGQTVIAHYDTVVVGEFDHTTHRGWIK